jgi:thymidylate kinase
MRGERQSVQEESESFPKSSRRAEQSIITIPAKAVIRGFFKSLEEKGVRFCHWKSNIRLDETLAGNEDIDLLVHRRDAVSFHAALLENGFKLAQSRSGMGHPGVFHALSLEEVSGELVHLHAYHQIVSGDSLVKNYRLQIEDVLLGQTRYVQGIRVPAPEAELVLFALRTTLKHVNLVEILMVNHHYQKVSSEMAWLRAAADADKAAALCTAMLPAIEPALFGQLLDAIENDGALAHRVVLGWRVAWRLRDQRRLGHLLGSASRLRRLLFLVLGRFRRRKDMVLQTGGLIVALVGPKATGKSTLTQELATRLGKHLDVHRIHAGKPPLTALTLVPRVFMPIARRLFRNERSSEYERPERRQEKRFSLIYVLHMTLLAYERRKLLRRALRTATAGGIVISDRYPSANTGAIDSSCFDESAVAKCGWPLKRWLMNTERALYKGLPKPDLIIRLIAPMDLSIERDAHRVKEGGPDSQAIERRWGLESHADFGGLPVVEINTNQPLDETTRNVVATVWAAL